MCTTFFSRCEIVQYPGSLLCLERAYTLNTISLFSLISPHHGTDFLAYSQILLFKHAFYCGLYKRGLIFVCTRLLPLTSMSARVEEGAPQSIYMEGQWARNMGACPVPPADVYPAPQWQHPQCDWSALEQYSSVHSCVKMSCRLCSPPSLTFSAGSCADVLVICSRLLSAAAPWDLSKMFENERARTINTHWFQSFPQG